MCEKFTHCTAVLKRIYYPERERDLVFTIMCLEATAGTICYYMKKTELNSYVANVMAKKVDFVQIH